MALSRNALGRTELQVSSLSLGTAALGIDYGLPGSTDFERPTFRQSVDLVLRALDAGVNFFDTAPAYGDAEDILGVALKHAPEVVIASKASITWNRDSVTTVEVVNELHRSVEGSLKRLSRDRLDLLQLHSANEKDVADERVLRGLDALRREGMVTGIGVTVYGERAALSAISSGVIDVVQIAFSMLDQRPLHRVFPEASRRGVAVVVRSALLKGALTSRWRTMPEEMRSLQAAVGRVVDTLEIDDHDLAAMALRYCISHVPPVASVLIGAASTDELDEALVAAGKGPLPPQLLSELGTCSVEEEALLNPSLWP